MSPDRCRTASLLILALATMFASMVAPCAAADPPPVPPTAEETWQAIVSRVAPDGAWLHARKLDATTDQTLQVRSESIVERVKTLAAGDRVELSCMPTPASNGAAASLVLTSIQIVRIPITWPGRLLALGLSALILAVLAFVATQFTPAKLLEGEDKRYSTSKTQAVMWFAVLLASYGAVNLVRVWHGGLGFLGGVAMPQNLLILSGLTGLTAVGAKVSTTGQVARGFTRTAAVTPKLANLVEDDAGRPELFKFQVMVMMLIAVLMYAFSALHFLDEIELRRSIELPDVDATLLGVLGIGQLAYVAKKAVVPEGA